MTVRDEWRTPADAVPPGRTVRFRLACRGRPADGFLVNHGGSHHAFLNRCPHIGTPLDLWPNEFLSEDGRLIVCATHGALFEPSTGACIAGPCAGDALTRLAVRLEGGDVVVACPGS